MSSRVAVGLESLGVLLGLLVSACAGATAGARDPGAVSAEGALTSPVLPAGEERTVYARVRVRAQSVGDRPSGPVNVALACSTGPAP